jgi:glutamine amidotransferase
MCIAIYKPEEKIISKATLQECYSANPDGAGFMFAEDKQLHIQKGYFNFDSFYDAYKQHQDKKVVIHFRIKTHGEINETNCHPFAVNNSLAFVHNGIINGLDGDKKLSDTIHFNEQILQPLVNKWGNLALFQDPMINLIENRIGYSKLIFLDRHGNHKIMNEGKGQWDDGVWYSNNSYKPYVAPVSTWQTSSWLKDYEYPIASKKKVTPIKRKYGVMIGDMVELLEEVKDDSTNKVYETGELFEIVAVNKDFTADLMYENEKGDVEFVYNVPYHSLNFVDDFEDDTLDPVGVPAYHTYASPYLLKGKTK